MCPLSEWPLVRRNNSLFDANGSHTQKEYIPHNKIPNKTQFTGRNAQTSVVELFKLEQMCIFDPYELFLTRL